MKYSAIKPFFRLLLFFLFWANFNSSPTHAQSILAPADSFHKQRFQAVAIGGGAAYSGVMFGLYHLWYKDYPMGGFRFVNDNRDWLQMDKFGHAFSAYQYGVYVSEVLRWSGVDEEKVFWYGGLSGFVLLLPIEILDGFSKEWGFSWGDFAANAFGSAFYITQEKLWKTQKVKFKFSFSPSPYADKRPNVLGSGLVQQLVKDYNGQIYWFSFNPSPQHLPDWLNVSLGYSGNGMLGGAANPEGYRDIERYRQFLFSLDVDLTKVKTNKRWVRTLLDAVNILKIPAPALEYNERGIWKVHPVYY